MTPYCPVFLSSSSSFLYSLSLSLSHCSCRRCRPLPSLISSSTTSLSFGALRCVLITFSSFSTLLSISISKGFRKTSNLVIRVETEKFDCSLKAKILGFFNLLLS
ncbi:hypothetical protein RIF29_28001 [Crotalaria pallida]|uniref:Uncharacterized protein n=1 Tax=Crotalaria pallida TaxID=3830 RepID=A0AAN9I1J5_CROPI